MSVNALTLGTTWLLLAAGLAQATPEAGLHSLDDVRRAAERAVRAGIDSRLDGVKLTAASLDGRLRLPACAGPLDTHAQPPRGTQARVLARVACNRGVTWSVNVPVDIRRTHGVLVLKRAIARGEAISAADVVAERREVAGIASPYVARPEELARRVTRRPLPAGTAVTADSLTAALLIHRGQSVTLTASAGGFEVRAPGRALADATPNQRVRVQNLASLKVVEGVAESVGVVRVNP